ncbi:MAG: oligopeptide transporter, OPT family [Candidatus Marinimicrobia bacterium]|nr:oligopeptide transporter, OPT family [Candidatus Neomarinimicrobiota bacterium]
MSSQSDSNQGGSGISTFVPYISAETKLPEITIKAVILGVILAAVLAGANAYLGLFAGLTVSASIPAAVISMAILRLFKKSNILENNIVQTAASSGESLAAGVIFTIPALIMLNHWTSFNYLQTTLIAALGGVIGVLFTIPLRRALIIEAKLKYPEGIATAEILKSGEKGGSTIKYLIWSSIAGAGFKFAETGLHLWSATWESARYMMGTLAYFGVNLSPALVSVGYIVGLNIATLVFLGGVISWIVAIPIYVWMNGIPMEEAVHAAGDIWSTQIRYLGVGAMVVGGLWALINLRKPLINGIRSSLQAYHGDSGDGNVARVRTEHDVSMKLVLILLIASIVPLFILYSVIVEDISIGGLMAVLMIIAGFLFSAVAAYMAGLVGSSNNPISGVTIATILTSAALLAAFMGTDSPIGPAAAILIGAVVCCAAAIGGDVLQDLKAGQLLGATPWKQQVMEVVGVLAAAVVMAPVLTLLLKAYGIGVATAAHPNPLAAPQATLMASVALGVFRGGLPMNLIYIGGLIAVTIILIDKYLEKQGSSFRMPVLAVAVGIYLPLELSSAIFIGGLIAYAASRFYKKKIDSASGDEINEIKESEKKSSSNGLLFASGLITGEALVGIFMAIPIVMYQDRNVFALVSDPIAIPGMLALAAIVYVLYRAARGSNSS